jgi:hypothetical protein
MTLYSGGSTTMFTLGFFAGIALSPFRAGVTLMAHPVKIKTLSQSNSFPSPEEGQAGERGRRKNYRRALLCNRMKMRYAPDRPEKQSGKDGSMWKKWTQLAALFLTAAFICNPLNKLT